jgi:hypothetical protein
MGQDLYAFGKIVWYGSERQLIRVLSSDGELGSDLQLEDLTAATQASTDQEYEHLSLHRYEVSLVRIADCFCIGTRLRWRQFWLDQDPVSHLFCVVGDLRKRIGIDEVLLAPDYGTDRSVSVDNGFYAGLTYDDLRIEFMKLGGEFWCMNDGVRYYR